MINEEIWIDVIEGDVVYADCYKMTAFPLDAPLWNREAVQDWLEAVGFHDIVDFRVVTGHQVRPWAAPELEWAWIETMTKTYKAQPPPMN